MKPKTVFSYIIRIIISIILIQVLFLKFTGAPESIYLFEMIGLEPIGRYSSALVELLAGILMLIPTTKTWGALLTVGTMIGALFFHLTTLGIVVNGDGGLLFGMAIVTFILAITILLLHKEELPFNALLNLLTPKISIQMPKPISDKQVHSPN